jgi:hypothetical protein
MDLVLVLELLEKDYKNAWNFTGFNHRIRTAIICALSEMT